MVVYGVNCGAHHGGSNLIAQKLFRRNQFWDVWSSSFEVVSNWWSKKGVKMSIRSTIYAQPIKVKSLHYIMSLHHFPPFPFTRFLSTTKSKFAVTAHCRWCRHSWKICFYHGNITQNSGIVFRQQTVEKRLSISTIISQTFVHRHIEVIRRN